MKTKICILGAGPTGLSIANELKRKKIKDFLIVEKEKKAGGLCRSKQVDGFPLDIGGGHFLDTRNLEVLSFVFDFMPENEWNRFERNSKIYINNQYINYPIESNIYQFTSEIQKQYLDSIATAGCNVNEKEPIKFVEWITWKLGEKIANDYMLPYNKKMFGDDLDKLGTYWLNKLPNVSYQEVLQSCIDKKPYGSIPAHKNFFYPKKYGYGELWERMANNLNEKIIYDFCVDKIDFENKYVVSKNEKIEADIIIVTIPWTSIKEYKNVNKEIINEINQLKHTSIVVDYFCDNYNSNSQWIYIPNLSINYHRVLLRNNFCIGSKGYWTETNAERYVIQNDYHYMNEYAYPLNTIEKPKSMKKILSYFSAKQIYGIGRWGEWQHYNSDVCVEKALNFVGKII